MLFSVLVFLSALSLNLSVAPIDAVAVFSKGEGGYYCHKIPYLLVTSSNTVIAFAEGRGKDGRTSCDDFSGTDLVYKRSSDGGKTWTSLQLFYSNSTTDDTNVIGNAAPVVDASTGRIWLPFCRNNEEVWISFSDDDGATWSAPVYHPQLVLPSWKWVGLGPPAGIQLRSGRLLIPSYHTTLIKGDGCLSKGHTVYSDDHGATWHIGSEAFGAPYLANECQAVQLKNGSVLINARTLSTHRIQVLSHDAGLSFDSPVVVDPVIQQTVEGCEGSLIRDVSSNVLYFSNPNSDAVIRRNMTVFQSTDEGVSWNVLVNVDTGAVSYSAMQLYPWTVEGDTTPTDLLLLYERSNSIEIVFEPDEIVLWKVPRTPAV